MTLNAFLEAHDAAARSDEEAWGAMSIALPGATVSRAVPVSFGPDARGAGALVVPISSVPRRPLVGWAPTRAAASVCWRMWVLVHLTCPAPGSAPACPTLPRSTRYVAVPVRLRRPRGGRRHAAGPPSLRARWCRAPRAAALCSDRAGDCAAAAGRPASSSSATATSVGPPPAGPSARRGPGRRRAARRRRRPEPSRPGLRDLRAAHRGAASTTWPSASSGCRRRRRGGAAVAGDRRRGHPAAQLGPRGHGRHTRGQDRARERRRRTGWPMSSLADCAVAEIALEPGAPPRPRPKSVIDRVGGLLLLVCCRPAAARMVVAVRLESRGPGLFTPDPRRPERPPVQGLQDAHHVRGRRGAQGGARARSDEGNGVLFKIRQRPADHPGRPAAAQDLARRAAAADQRRARARCRWSVRGPALPDEVAQYDEMARRAARGPPGHDRPVAGQRPLGPRLGHDGGARPALHRQRHASPTTCASACGPSRGHQRQGRLLMGTARRSWSAPGWSPHPAPRPASPGGADRSGSGCARDTPDVVDRLAG